PKPIAHAQAQTQHPILRQRAATGDGPSESIDHLRGQEHYQVVVHVDAAALADPDQPGQSALEDGPLPPEPGMPSFHERVQAPLPGDALEGVLAPVLEAQAGAESEVLDRARDQNLSGGGEGLKTGGHVDSHPGEPSALQLALSGMHTGANADAETLDTRAY